MAVIGSVFALMMQHDWLTYVAVLSALAVAVALGYATGRGPFSGAIGAAILLMSIGFAVGLTPTRYPVYGVNPPDQIQMLVLVGMGFLVVGVVVAYRARHVGPDGSADRIGSPGGRDTFLVPARDSIARAVVVCAILGSCLNYATGEIPLLAQDVNSARFGSGATGIFDQYWPIFFPLLQVSVILAAIDWKISRFGASKTWRTLGTLSLLLLALSGSRSLTLIPIAAAAFLWIEVKRPSLAKIAAGSLAALLVVGAFGTFRSQQSDSAALGGSRDGIVGEIQDSVQLALQTGPRVWTRAQDKVGAGGTGGSLLYGDFANLISPTVERSDRVVTRILGRDPAVIGGAPPTVWGGLALDFGFLGVVFGGLLLGIVLSVSAAALHRKRSTGSALWFAYVVTYVMLSTYSYVSLRPSWIIVGLFSIFALSEAGDRHADSDGFKISNFHGRR